MNITHADIYTHPTLDLLYMRAKTKQLNTTIPLVNGASSVRETLDFWCKDNNVNPTNKDFVIEVLEWYLAEEMYSEPDSAIKRIPYKEICIFGWKPCGEGGIIRKITEIIGYNTYCDCCINMRHLILGGLIALPIGILIGILL